MPVLERCTSFRCEIQRIFDVLTCPENIPRLVPPEIQLQIIDAPQRLQAGSRLEVKLLGYGIPQTVVYEIVEFQPPYRFTEKQTKGPLAKYLHYHELAERDEGVLVTDRIEFDPPGGLLGFLLPVDRLRSSFEEGLAHRHSELGTLLEAP